MNSDEKKILIIGAGFGSVLVSEILKLAKINRVVAERALDSEFHHGAKADCIMVDDPHRITIDRGIGEDKTGAFVPRSGYSQVLDLTSLVENVPVDFGITAMTCDSSEWSEEDMKKKAEEHRQMLMKRERALWKRRGR